MSNSGSAIFAMTCFAVALSIASANDASAQELYYIDEHTDFTNNGCPNISDVHVITASLQTALNADGWSGQRWVNADAWPQDFMESCSSNYGLSGIDDSAGDNATLSVYAGHGSWNAYHFGDPNLTICDVIFDQNMRLGSMNGNDAGYIMMLTSYGASDIPMVGTQWPRQVFGFYGSPFISGANKPRDFFNATSSSTNVNAWLNTMSGIAPRVLSFSSTSISSCWTNVHGVAKLKAGVLVSSRPGGPSCNQGQPTYYWCGSDG